MNEIINWVKARSKEWSTLRGIVGLIAGIASVYFLFTGDTDKATGAIGLGVAAIGFVNTIRTENNGAP